MKQRNATTKINSTMSTKKKTSLNNFNKTDKRKKENHRKQQSSTDLAISSSSADHWVRHVDTETGDPYWFNASTNESTWDDPNAKTTHVRSPSN